MAHGLLIWKEEREDFVYIKIMSLSQEGVLPSSRTFEAPTLFPLPRNAPGAGSLGARPDCNLITSRRVLKFDGNV